MVIIISCTDRALGLRLVGSGLYSLYIKILSKVEKNDSAFLLKNRNYQLKKEYLYTVTFQRLWGRENIQ